MARLIDADALLEAMQYRLPQNDAVSNLINDCVEISRRQVMIAPTMEAVEVKHGRWEVYQIPPIMCCSECDWATDLQSDFNYCPNCGAKMDGERMRPMHNN